jgi:hypothetical protein
MNIVGTPYSDVQRSSATAARVCAGSKPGAGITIVQPCVVYQQIRYVEGRAFFELGFVLNSGFLRRGVECRQHVPGAVPAHFRFAGNDPGNVDRRAGKEVPGHFHMNLAGHRRQLSAEG